MHTKVSLPHSHFGMAVGSLLSTLGNSSSFVSQILNSTVLVTPTTIVKSVNLCVDLTTLLSHEIDRDDRKFDVVRELC